jgi:DNA-directed RNA polymerase subunit RPC12/RpoP
VKPPIIIENYQCGTCWHPLSRFPDRPKKTVLYHCQNCGKEYLFSLNEDTGRFDWTKPESTMKIADSGSINYTPPPAFKEQKPDDPVTTRTVTK